MPASAITHMPPSGVQVLDPLELLAMLEDELLLELVAPPIPVLDDAALALDVAPVPLVPHAKEATVKTPIVVNAKVSGS